MLPSQNPDDDAVAIEGAIIAVLTDVLGATGIGPEDEFSALCPELPKAVRIVTLLNQLLGTELTVLRLFTEGTPRALAALLAAEGVTAPRLAAVAAHDAGDTWREFWETTYRFANPKRNDRFNTAGWIDSRSLTSLPREQMREWVRTTVSRLRALAPRSVLDIGCGAGLILFQLAPACDRYVGADFSSEAVRQVREAAAVDAGLRHVDVIHADALRATELMTDTFDLVLMNSVVQYFPDIGYLTAVLSNAARRTAGTIFLGDVRNRALHRAMHVSSAAAVDDSTPVGLVRSAADQAMAVDSPLLLAPAELRQHALGIGASFTPLVRRGTQLTEMNRFRYDAMLTFEETPVPRADREVSWAELRPSNEDVRAAVVSAVGESLVVRDIPDVRTIGAVRLAAAVDTAPPEMTMGSLRRGLATTPAIDPEETWEWCHSAGYGTAMAPAETPGYVDVAFLRGQDDRAASRLLTTTAGKPR